VLNIVYKVGHLNSPSTNLSSKFPKDKVSIKSKINKIVHQVNATGFITPPRKFQPLRVIRIKVVVIKASNNSYKGFIFMRHVVFH
jgi:hypothetical protein